MRELLVLTLEGQQYGIWKDDVQSIGDLSHLHRIPLSPACIAGMSIMDDRAVTLADLSVCVGHGPSSGKGGRILLMPGREKVTGFLVEGGIASLSIDADTLYPIPPYLATPLIDTCVVHDGAVLPLINIAILYNRIQTAEQEPPRPALEVSDVQPREARDVKRLRWFHLGDELYGADAAGIAEQSVKPGTIARLTLLPRYVRGLTFYEDRILPVIDLAQRVTGRAAASDATMIPAEIGGAWFGLLVDRDHGPAAADALAIAPLPPLARIPWIRAAVMSGAGTIPLLDLPVLLSPRGADEAVQPLPQRYAPGSRFADLFGHGEVDVLEFSLLGVRHALPRLEVDDVVDFEACRKIPDAPEIVIGVAEYRGEILPLLDLAMVFGRRSPVGPGWRMIVLKNGDFRGLVITETVYGERRLAQEIQRTVPIRLPHRVVYGCYPDADSVRLILNVAAMAVHFEKALVQELLPALSPEMRQAPAEIVASLLGEEGPAIIRHEETVPATPVEAVPIAAASAGEKFVPKAPPGAIEPAHAEPEEEAIIEVVSEHEVAVEIGLDHLSDQHTSEALVSEIEKEQRPIVRAEEIHPAHEVEPVTPEKPETLREETQAVEEVTTREGGSSELSSLEQAEKGNPTEESTGAEPVVTEKRIYEESERLVSEESETAAQEEPRPLQQVQTESALVVEQYAAFEATDLIREKGTEELKTPAETAGTYLQREEETPAPHPVQAHAETPSNGTRRFAYAVLGVLLIAVIYFFAGSQKSREEKTVQDAATEKTVITLPEKSQPKAEPEKPLITRPEKAQQAEKPRPQLVLEVPAERPLDVHVYVVVEGDTLWDISERFTGNPFNYPRIAGENRIADPDLIFPGQKITLKQKSPESK